MGDFSLPMTIGGTAQEGTSNPGGSWSVLMMISFFKWWICWWWVVLSWTLFLLTRRDWWGVWSPKATLAAMTMEWWSSKSLGQRGECTTGSLPWTSGGQTLAPSENCLVEYHGIKPSRGQESWLLLKDHLFQALWYCDFPPYVYGGTSFLGPEGAKSMWHLFNLFSVGFC